MSAVYVRAERQRRENIIARGKARSASALEPDEFEGALKVQNTISPFPQYFALQSLTTIGLFPGATRCAPLRACPLAKLFRAFGAEFRLLPLKAKAYELCLRTG